MARTRQQQATRLLRRFEDAIVAKQDAEQAYAAIPLDAFNTHYEEVQNLHRAKIKAEQKFNMLRGTLWRAIVNSTEEL